MYRAGARVAQEMVELVDSFGNVVIAFAIDDVDMFLRMNVEEAQTMNVFVPDYRMGRSWRWRIIGHRRH